MEALTDKETKVIQKLRTVEWGKLIVEVQKNEPVRVVTETSEKL